MKIINLNDSRYNLLSKIFSYEYNDLVSYFDGYKRPFYFIPPELVINNIETYSLYVNSNITDYHDKDQNWISNWRFKDLLSQSCNLTLQEYYDLCILHINETDDRPKCGNEYCNNKLSFGPTLTINYGYPPTLLKYGNPPCCCKSCAGIFQANHPELCEGFGIYKMNTWELKVKSQMNHFIYSGNPNDQTSFYLARTKTGKLKLGITTMYSSWARQEYSKCKDEYISIHELNSNLTRLDAAYLEASIKLKFKGEEYLNWIDLHQVISEYKLQINNITNPFS